MKTVLGAMLFVLSIPAAVPTFAQAASPTARPVLELAHHEGEKRPDPAGDEHHEGEKKPEPLGGSN